MHRLPCLLRMHHGHTGSAQGDDSAFNRVLQSPRCRRSLLALVTISAGLLLAGRTTSADDARESAIEVPSHGASMPMLDIGGRPMVEVRINGRGPYPFIFDTGATTSVIDSGLCAELGGCLLMRALGSANLSSAQSGCLRSMR